jgi:hypothetical protein
MIAQTVSEFIVVDQFGYLPNQNKVAILRNPQTGFDSNLSYSPSATLQVIDVSTGQSVFAGAPIAWNGGATDASSGDQVWWFDFSSVAAEGDYYILDNAQQLKSDNFSVSNTVYNEVIYHAFRTYFYQRSGFAKEVPYAEAAWADGASHLSDTISRKWDTPNDASSEKDVSGGWYDAGDYNKYTTWTSNYIFELIQAYQQNPTIWTDDFDIPESNNGIPDIIDEIKWGTDHLLRLQMNDGSMISVVDAANGYPPSTAIGASLYGNVNTSSTLAAAGAFALAAKFFEDEGETAYAGQLAAAALNAWNWAVANPNVLWYNNDANYGTQGIAAGQQEVNDYKRLGYKMRAASRLLDLGVGNANDYIQFIEGNYGQINLMSWNYAFPFQQREQEILLFISEQPEISLNVRTEIKTDYDDSMEDDADNWPSVSNATDPYRSHLKDYVWGSNGTKAKKALMFLNLLHYNVGSRTEEEIKDVAAEYLHYLHGQNPINKVYLSNMNSVGAYNSVNEFYHSWFYDGSDWDNAQTSLYGPASGFLVGGANPSYAVDGCCPNNCGSANNNSKCSSIDLTRVTNQPNQKSYMDFNNNWPLNSWSITENSLGYQTPYLRLLSHFIEAPLSVATEEIEAVKTAINLVPNPASTQVTIVGVPVQTSWEMFNASGQVIASGQNNSINLNSVESGAYFVRVFDNTEAVILKLIVQ